MQTRNRPRRAQKLAKGCSCSTDVKEQLVCPICLNHQHFPLMFPCTQHSACFKCIVQLISMNRYPSWEDNSFVSLSDDGCKCPLCGEDTWFTEVSECIALPPSILSVCYSTQILQCPYCSFQGSACVVQGHLKRGNCVRYTCRDCKETYTCFETHLRSCIAIPCDRCPFIGNYETLRTHHRFHEKLLQLKGGIENLGNYQMTATFTDNMMPLLDQMMYEFQSLAQV